MSLPIFLGLVDVGHGHLSIIWNRDSAIVLDTGRNGAVLSAFFRQFVGHKRIEMLLITHLDVDHAGAAKLLLNPRNDFEIREICYNDPPESVGSSPFLRSLQHEQAKRAAADQDFRRSTPIAGRSETLLDGVEVAIHAPDPDWARSAPDKNEQSAIVSASVGGRTQLVVCGDVGLAGLIRVDLSPLKPVDLLLGPHHGGGPRNSPAPREALQRLRNQLDPATVIFAFDTSSSDHRPRPDLVAADVRCLQLSNQCHQGNPIVRESPVHLGASTGPRGARSLPCAGTMVFELSAEGPKSIPDRGPEFHERYLSGLDSPLCRRG